MKLALHKWYLDFQAPEVFEYCYATLLEVGPLLLTGRELHRHVLREGVPEPTADFRGFGRALERSTHCLRGTGVALAMTHGVLSLRLEHDRGSFAAEWTPGTGALPRVRRPLFANAHGSCEWKVWTARSAVVVRERGLDAESARLPQHGLGYADFVRFELPPWRIPFESLCWGRLFGAGGFVILFHLALPDTRIGACSRAGRWDKAVDVRVIREPGGLVSAFEWTVADARLRAETVAPLHVGPILDAERVAGWLPKCLRTRLSSGGIEEKYWVSATIDGVPHTGPMEVVRWT